MVATILLRSLFLPSTPTATSTRWSVVYEPLLLAFLLLFGATTVQAQVTGKVFRDYNADGIQNTPISSTAVTVGEQGVPGVVVTAYPVAGAPVSATTDNNGAYSFANAGVSAAGSKLRLEFTSIFPDLFSGPQNTVAAGSGTIVQFVTAGSSTTANLAVNDALQYCQTNPLLATPCYISGNPAGGGTAGTSPAIVGFDFNSSGDATGILAANGVAVPVDAVTYKIAGSVVGSTWGMAWQRKTKRLFVSAFVKRHVGIGPLGEGGIYILDHSAAGTPTVTSFVDVNTIGINTGTVGTGATPALRNTSRGLNNSTTTATVGGDPTSYSAVGKVGLGDLDISDDGKTLWVINLKDQTLNSIIIDSDNNPSTAPTAADVQTYPIPNPCTGTQRPFALKVYKGNVYVGMVCEASLSAYIYKFDGSTFTPVQINGTAPISLTYARTGGTVNCPTVSTNWHVWTDATPPIPCDATNLADILYHYPVPMLSDIEFDVDGSMILTFMDRTGHQIGAHNTQLDGTGLENYHASGDILRVCNLGGGSYAMQGTAGCPNKLANGQGPNGGEYYFRDEFNENAGSSYVGGTRGVLHSETTTGGVAVLPGSGESVVAVFDPWGTFYVSGGVNFFNNSTGGSRALNYILYFGETAGSFFNTGASGKANGLGDVEILCNPAPIEIGNRVWLDTDKNGIQDPAETPIAGVTVQLFAAGGTTPLATTVTDASGLYVFKSTSTTALTYNTAYEVRIPTVQSALTSMSFTTANTGANEGIDSDFAPGATAAVTSLTTGDLGQNVHTFDAGLICDPPVLAAINSQSICSGGSFALPLSASVTSGTATGYQWYLSDATGSSLTIISGATNLTFTPTSAQLPTSTGGTKYYAISAYNSNTACSDMAVVSLFIKPTQTITFIVPSLAAVTQCANTTMNLSVTTNAKAPDAIKFVYFTSPQSGTAMYTGGTELGTVSSGTLATNTVSLNNVQLPDLVGGTAQTLYVYALLESADGLCLPIDQFTITLNPRPAITVSGNTIFCVGTTDVLTAGGPTGTTYQWYLNSGTAVVGTTNPFTTPVINANTTYRVRGTLLGCVSDFASYNLTPVVCTSCTATPTSVGGVAYRDFNSDGAQGTTDPGLSNITVTIFSCDATNQSAQVATMQTDINGAYSFTGLTAGTTYRVEFSNLPAGYSPTYRGTNNGTTVQFTQPGSCSTSVGLNVPTDYCQANPKIATPCYIDGAAATALNTTGLNDVLVSFDYNTLGASLVQNKSVDGTRNAIGSTWGLAYNKQTNDLYAAAFLKRHVGLANGQLGVIYVKDYTNPSAATVPWLDVSTLPGVSGNWQFLTDAQRGLVNAGTPTADPQAFSAVAAIGLGDIDISDDGKTLYAMDLTNRQLLAIDVATKTLIGKYPVPDICTGTVGPMYFSAASTRPIAGGTSWTKGIVYNTDNNALEYAQTITNPNSASTGTTDASLYATSVYTSTSMVYNFPVGNGSYGVKMHFATNLSTTNRNTNVLAEGATVISGLDVYALSGNQVNLGLTRSFTTTVTDGVLTIQLQNNAPSVFAAMSGFEIVPVTPTSPGVTRPFATKYRNGKVYVGAVCDASFSQNRNDLSAAVFEFNPTTGTYAPTPVLSIPLNYKKGAGAGASNNSWEPWTSIYPNNTDAGIRFLFVEYFDVYAQPVLSDIEFDNDGSMILGFFDRFGHQTSGALNNRRPDNTLSYHSVANGDLLRAYYNGSTYELENNGKEGASSPKAPSVSGTNNNQGPGGGEFYVDELAGLHYEIPLGGIAMLPGSNEMRTTAADPLAAYSGGIAAFNNLTGNKISGNSVTLYSGVGGGVQNKASGLGDLEILCNLAPIQIGNRVWRDDNENGIQDPCEPAIPGAVVKLYDATKTTVIASATTNAAGEYYFSSATVVAGTSTSAVSTSLLTYNTTYGLVITSLGTSSVVAGLSLTNVTPLTPGESGTLNSGTTLANNDAKLDVVGGISSPCIKLTTGGPGDVNHTYDFGITIPPCAKPTLAAIASQSICQGSGAFAFPLSSSVVSNTVTSVQWYLTNASGTSFTAISGATSLSLSSALAVPPTVPGQKFYALIGQNGLSALCSDTILVNVYMKPTQTIAFTAPAAATVIQCANTPLILTVNSNATAPDAIRFVYFTSPQSGTAMYTGGVDFGTVASTTVVATKAVSLTTVVPPNTTTGTLTYYLYALLQSSDGSCKPVDSFVLNVTAKPDATIGGTTTVCQGTSTTLTLPPGLSYKWSTGELTRQISPLISATTTTAVYSATLTSIEGCASDPATFTVTGIACTSCVAGAGRVGGTVYNDFDANGVQLASEPGLSGVTVNIYACDPNGNSVLAGTTTTDFMGNYFFSGLTDGVTYRVEFSNVPAQFEQSARGTNSGTSVQFVKSPTCGVDLGLSNPATYCAANAPVAVVCFARNTDGTAEPTIITISYADGIDFAPRGATDVNKEWSTPQGTLPATAKTVVATVGSAGTTFGLTWDNTHSQLLSGAFMRAYAPMKANTSANSFGEGIIYKIDYASGTAVTPTTWLDLETVLSDGVSGTYVADAAYPGSQVFGRANSNPDKIGYTGLGSMRMALDNSELYVVNLNKQEVLVIPVDAAGAPVSAQLKRFPLPTDGCPTGTWSDGRPYQAALGLGVHPITKRVYATVTCTGPTQADLKGLVYSFDPAAASPSAASFQLETTIPLNSIIPATNPNVAIWYEQIVHPWEVVTANASFYENSTGSNTAQHTHPWLGEVEFDQQPNGTYGMLVGTRNRYHDIINSSFYVTGGMLHRVGNTGTDVAPAWSLESNGVAADMVSTVGWTLNGATNAGGNTDLGNRFFKYVGREGTMLAGTLDYVPGRPEIVMPAMDNIFNSGTSGMTWLNRTTGERSRDARLLADYSGPAYDNVNFTKSNNWGGVVVLCDDAPIQIGNRVWRDDNQNGIQDPCEPAIPGAVVKLYDAAKTTVLASVTTNAAGEYYFSSTTITTGNSTSSVATSALTPNTTYGLVITSLGTSSVVTGLSLTNVTPLTPGESGTLNSGTTLANNDAKLDVVGGISSPCIKLTTGDPGDINHTYDFGIAVPPCDKLVLDEIPSQTICQGVTFAMPLTTKVISSTYTSLQWYVTNAAGTSYTAISGATNLTLTAVQAVTPTVGQTKYYALIGLNGLSPLCADTAFVDLTLKPTPTITAFTVSGAASATTTVCANTTISLGVTTNIVGPDQIQFVYFAEPLASPADAYTAADGQLLGSVVSTSVVGNKTLTLSALLPDNLTADNIPIYVYAIVQTNDVSCGVPVFLRTIILKPRPITSIDGESLVCRGTTTVLTASGEAGTTFRWFLNNGPAVVSTVNPYTTPAISTTATYKVLATLNLCVSDTAEIQLIPVTCTPCVGGTGTVGGIVFRDFNTTGVKDAADLGMDGITITIFRCDPSGTSVQVAQMQTDIKGQYSFTGLTGGTDYRVEFSGFPAGYEPTYRGTNNGTTVQFTKPGSCSISLGLNQPGDFCQANPLMVTTCFVNGGLNATAPTDVLVKFPFTNSGTTPTPSHLANKAEIGSVWGVAYNRTTRQLYTSTLLKRHAGVKDADGNGTPDLGVIYVTSNPYATSSTNTVWADLSKAPYNLDLGAIGTDASRGLGLPLAPSNDPTAFPLVGKLGLGDIDISEDGSALWVVTPKTNQVHKIAINADGTAGAMQSFTIPTPCADNYNALYIKAGGSEAGKLVGDFVGDEYYAGGAALASTGRTGTAYSSARTGTSFSYLIPLATGTYNVTLSFGNNATVRSETVTVGGTTQTIALSANASQSVAFNNLSVSELLSIQVGSLNTTAALLSGIKITSATGVPFVDRSWPFAVAYKNGNVYVGTTCAAELSQDKEQLQSTVYQLSDNGSTTFTPVLTVPLTYIHGLPGSSTPANRWLPWTGAMDKGNNPALSGSSGFTHIYPQPVLSDIDFLDTGDMVIGFFDRYGHQTGDYNYTTFGTSTIRTTVAGDVLRANFDGSSYTLEQNGRISGQTSSGGVGNNQGPGGGEFYVADNYAGSAHQETSYGGLAVVPGTNMLAVTVLDPINVISSGIMYFSNTNGTAARSYQITPPLLNTTFFSKANALGDLQALCDLAPIQIGNRVWRDDNRDGIQDPCEPAIPGAVVTLYNADKTTAIASVTTNAAGEYYFASTTLTAGTSTSSVATSALTINTTYALVITSLGTSTVVTSQGLALTDVSPLTPGESSLVNSGTSAINNDAIVDAGKPCIKLTTGGPGEINHTYDFGIVKFVCSLTATASASSQTVCQNQPVMVIAEVSPVGNYTYVWSAPAGVTLTGGNTATATATASVAGLQTFTVTVSSAPTCFTTATVSVSVVECAAPLASLGDKVFADVNKNGVYDAGDTPIAGVTVTLISNGTVVAVTTTASSGTSIGCYSFTGLTPGVPYSVSFTTPAGYTATTPLSGTDTTIDSNPINGITAPVTLTAGENNPTIDAGYILLPASLGDYVWLDTNKNGQQDPTESGVASVTAVLCDATSGTVISTTVTDGAGKYLFTNLAPGSYIVKFTAPLNTTFTTPNSGTDATDSDVASLTGATGSTGVYSLTAGEQNLTVDAGLIPLTAGLGDYVFEDVNANGQQDAGDKPIAGVTVSLLSSGTLVTTTTTDVNGLYSFTGLTPGVLYSVSFTAPAGFTATTQNTGADVTDSDGNPVTGLTGTYSLTANEFNPTVDMGYYKPASLGDKVFADVNKNGVLDAGDTPITGVTVTLISNGTVVATTTTASSGTGIGCYSFTGLTPGVPYSVSFTTPVGYTATTPLSGTDTTIDSNPVGGITAPVTLTSGENNPTIDAGYILLPASLGDYVWLDTNKNGQQDPTESGVASVTAVLCDATSGTVISTTVTDGAGKYLFTNLAPGTYIVKFTAPANTTFTTPNSGTDATDSDVASLTGTKGSTGLYSLTAGEQNLTVDAGLIPLTAGLGDYVFEDKNANGIQDTGDVPIPGVKVTLYASGSAIASTTTDANGLYSFTGLTPATPYVVGFGKPAGYMPTAANVGTNDAIDSDANVATGLTGTYSLTANEFNPTVDAGFYKPASLGDYVFNDKNRDGVQNTGDLPIPGVVVTLYQNGSAVATTTTDVNGLYSFTGLTPGTSNSYVVGFTAPAGYSATTPLSGTDTTKDSNADPITGRTAAVTLASGENNPTIDAGFYLPTAGLGDYVFEDVNANGQQDAGDKPVAGVTVSLLSSSTLVATTTTNASGLYSFTGLTPGVLYSVSFTAPAGFTATTQNTGADVTDSDGNPATGLTGTYSLTANEFNPTVDMGYYKPASLGDKVFADVNRNGVYDAGDTPIAGVTVTLISNGTVVATTSTLTSGTAIGCYSFTGLTPGVPYSVSFTTPVGYTATTPLSGTDKTIDSNPVGGITAPVTLTSGENNPTIDAGFVRLLGSLGDYVWFDTNANGQQDPTESGVASVTAVLCDATSGTVISTTVTDGAGKYLFTNLAPGSYIVKFTAPAGTTFTTPNSGTDATDSDVASLTGATGSTGVYSLSAGEQNLTVDAGLISLLGSLGDYVWKDTNNNGLQDAGEPGTPGVTVQLFQVVGGVIGSSPIATTVTSSSGLYGFTNLPSGDYQVKFILPTSLSATCTISPKQNVGTNDTKDSDVNPLTGLSQIVTIDVTQPSSSTARNNPTVDLGLVIIPVATIGDPCHCFRVEYSLGEKRELSEVVEVRSSTGESWSVVSQTGMLALDSLVKHPVLNGTTLVEAPVGSGVYQLTFTHEDTIGYSITVTNGTQSLSIANMCSLYPTYTTTVLSQTMCRTDPPVALTAVANQPSSTQFFYVDKITNQRVYITQFDPKQFTAGEKIFVKLLIEPTDPSKCPSIIVQEVLISSVDCTTLGSIGDLVWKDVIRNGKYDAGTDLGVPNVTVRLLEVTSPVGASVVSTSLVSTTVTNGTGTYLFPNLPAGRYVVEFDKTTIPTECTLSPDYKVPGVGDSLDSDADPLTGRSPIIEIIPGDPVKGNVLTVDAALINPACQAKCVPIVVKRVR